MACLTVSMPYPPSANRLWRSYGRKVVRSADYVRWIKEAAWQIKETVGPDQVSGAYELSIIACPPDKRRRDIDNLIKPVSDALVAGTAIEDDHMCQKLTIEWDASIEGVLATISPRGPGHQA